MAPFGRLEVIACSVTLPPQTKGLSQTLKKMNREEEDKENHSVDEDSGTSIVSDGSATQLVVSLYLIPLAKTASSVFIMQQFDGKLTVIRRRPLVITLFLMSRR